MNCVSSIVHRNQKSDREEITIGALFGGCSPASRAADHPRKINDLPSLYVDLIVNQEKESRARQQKPTAEASKNSYHHRGGGGGGERERGYSTFFATFVHVKICTAQRGENSNNPS